MAQSFTLPGALTITAGADITPQNVPVAFTATNAGPDTVDLMAIAPSEVLMRTIPAGQQVMLPAPPQGQSWQVSAAPRRALRQAANVFGWVSTGLIAVSAVGGWELGKWVGREIFAHRH